MSLEFDDFDTTVSKVRPWAVELSMVTCVGPSWEWTNSSRVVHMGVALFQPYYSAPISASDADYIICLIFTEIFKMAPFWKSAWFSLVRNMYAAARIFPACSGR